MANKEIEQPQNQKPSTSTNTTPITQPNNGINLDDVESGYTIFLRKRWWFVLILALVSVGLGFISPPYGIALFIIVIASSRYFYENDLFHAFADTNHFNYQKKGQLVGQTGLIFNIGHGIKFKDIVSGVYQDHPLLLFIYDYTIGYGKGSHSYHRAVISINFGKSLPAFTLRRHRILQILDEEGESLRSKGFTEKVNLEGDFNKHFQVFIRPNTQDDVLSVLTPDIMEMLIGLDKYEVEATDNGDLNVYSSSYITKKQGLIDVFNVIKALSPKIGNFVSRQKAISNATQRDNA